MSKVVDVNGRPVTKGGSDTDNSGDVLTREQEVNLMKDLITHPGWEVYARLLRLNWERQQQMLLNPEMPREHESHTDEFLKGMIRGYQQAHGLPVIAEQQYKQHLQMEEAIKQQEAAQANADAEAEVPGFRDEALPPEYNDQPEQPIGGASKPQTGGEG